MDEAREEQQPGLCSSCGAEPAKAGQRWGRACHRRYMREWRATHERGLRILAKRHPDEFDAIRAELGGDVSRETVQSDASGLGAADADSAGAGMGAVRGGETGSTESRRVSGGEVRRGRLWPVTG